jgi:hypothetical protein
MAVLYLRPCANCGSLIIGGKSLFCGVVCKETAGAVRYARGIKVDGRDADIKVQDAAALKIAFAAGGGYDQRGRRLSISERSEVKAKSDNRCRACGAPGVEIDHISGSSNSMDNLQLLCLSCHAEKTAGSIFQATDEFAQLVHIPIRKRINSAEPFQPSDEPNWKYQRWTSSLPGQEVVDRWYEWAEANHQSQQIVGPEIAAAGMPSWADPWLWCGAGRSVDAIRASNAVSHDDN